MNSTVTLPPIKKNNVYEEVILHLKNYIIVNELRPGDRLPTEAALAESLEVSRLSVREALKVLESMGVVQSRTRDGTRLRAMTVKPAADHLRFLLDVQQVPMHEIAAARQAIECSMMPMIVAQAREESFERIRITNQLVEAAVAKGQAEAVVEADSQFHCALLAATGNRAIEGFGLMLQEFFQTLSRNMAVVQIGGPTVQEHWQIYEALRAGDAALASQVMNQHLEPYRNLTLPQTIEG